MKQPYKEFEKTPLWKVIDAAILDLQKNRDIDLATTREHIIGYICQQLVRKQVADKRSFARE
jgi:hypothetical protein